MSLSRAFTTRRNANKKSLDISPPIMPQRSLTTKHSFASGTIKRSKISAPVELISTTNMLSYNAPDLHPSGRTSDSISESETDRSPTSGSSTPPTSPDNSSEESSPTTPEPNHLSCYFGAGPNGLQTSLQGKPAEDAPVIPQRALSHTKKSSMSLSSKRSIGRMASVKNSIHTTRSSINMFAANVEAAPMEDVQEVQEQMEHPFGNELAQVSELAEEFGVQETMQIIDIEEQDLLSRGLFKFRAEDYMSEIHGLFMSTFVYSETKPSMAPMWI